MSLAPVVVGTDLSASAGEAIRQAGAWAVRIGAPLLVVHVAPDEIFRALEVPKVVDALTSRVEALVRPSGAQFKVVIEAGSPHAALVRLSDEQRAALTVVGASGGGAMERMLFGSTAKQVLRYAHGPVLVARTSPAGPVLGATDFSDEARLAAETAAKEARLRGAPLRLVHSLFEPTSPLSLLGPMLVSAPELPEADRDALRRTAEEMLRTLIEATGATGECAVVAGPPARTISEEARRVGASLVVVATRGRTGLARMALGSVAEAIAREAPCSVLAVRRAAWGEARP
jgi:nucleotide-binding universal stress UspA family protein